MPANEHYSIKLLSNQLLVHSEYEGSLRMWIMDQRDESFQVSLRYLACTTENNGFKTLPKV